MPSGIRLHRMAQYENSETQMPELCLQPGLSCLSSVHPHSWLHVDRPGVSALGSLPRTAGVTSHLTFSLCPEASGARHLTLLGALLFKLFVQIAFLAPFWLCPGFHLSDHILLPKALLLTPPYILAPRFNVVPQLPGKGGQTVQAHPSL